MPQTGRTPLLDSLRAAGYIKFLYDFRSGSVKDLMLTGVDFSTGTGGIIQRGGMSGNGSLVVPTTANPNMSGTAFSVIARLRPNAYLGAGTKPIIINDVSPTAPTSGFAFWITKATGNVGLRVYSDATSKESLSANSTVVLGQKKTFGASYKDNDAIGVQAYVEGIASGAAISTIGHAVAWRNVALKLFEGTGTVINNQLVCNLDYILLTNNYFLSAAEHLQLKNELEAMIPDWRPGGREVNPRTHALIHYHRTHAGCICTTAAVAANNPLSNTGFDVTTGTFSVTRGTGANGQLGKAIVCATNGTLTFRVAPAGTYYYSYYDGANWQTQATPIHVGNVFTLTAGQKLWLAGDSPSDQTMFRNT